MKATTKGTLQFLAGSLATLYAATPLNSCVWHLIKPEVHSAVPLGFALWNGLIFVAGVFLVALVPLPSKDLLPHKVWAPLWLILVVVDAVARGHLNLPGLTWFLIVTFGWALGVFANICVQRDTRTDQRAHANAKSAVS